MSSFKAICTDIDGTLLNQDRALSTKTIAVIRHLAQQGIPVILASSRMPKAMRHLQAELDILHCPLICYNGGYILDYSTPDAPPAVLHSTEIPADACAQVVALAAGTDVHVSLYREDEWYVPAEDQWAARERNNTRVNPELAGLDTVLSRWAAIDAGAHKIMCMGPGDQVGAIHDALAHRSDLNLYRSKDTYLEIAHGAISKATALDLLLQARYDFTLQDLIAFGDNYNDIDMLQAVGIGIAVGNAKDQVKAIARDITLPGKEDGVALALEKWWNK